MVDMYIYEVIFSPICLILMIYNKFSLFPQYLSFLQAKLT